MKSILDLTPEEYIKTSNTYTELIETTAGMTRMDAFDTLEICHCGAHYKFRGKVSKTLIERLGRMPTAGEVIMIVDSGFNHFGAKCTVHRDGCVQGVVNID